MNEQMRRMADALGHIDEQTSTPVNVETRMDNLRSWLLAISVSLFITQLAIILLFWMII